MAMLAETRRRRNYTLVPKGKALYEDEDRFGTKMLEKMGWSKGKGLGANLDGEKDFVRIRYKRDNEGFGFEVRDDHWTQHEKDFTGLLKNLHGEEVDGGEEDEANSAAVGFGFQKSNPNKESMKEKLTGKSLVEMSKTSRARVHYQKFARGKDLSRASEKDLANIFGRKAPSDADNIFSAFQAVNNLPEEKEETPTQEEKKEGVQIVHSGISISDYFKQKMEALKLKRSATTSCDTNPTKKIKSDESESNLLDEEVTYDEQKPKKKKKKKDKKDEDVQIEKVADQEEEDKPKESSEEKPKKKKKDKVKDKEVQIVEISENQVEEDAPTKETSGEKPKKKKKDKVKEVEIVEANDIQVEEDAPTRESSEEKPKKKKKDKVKEVEILEADDIQVEKDTLVEKSKKKKKKSKENPDSEENQKKTIVEDIAEVESLEEKPKKKKKKVQEQEDNSGNAETQQEPSSKKKKKKSELDSVNQTTSTDDEPSSQVTNTDPESTLGKEVEEEGEWQQVKSKREKVVEVSPDVEEQFVDDPKTHRVNSFVAEKFRNIDMPAFPGSNISQFKGYGMEDVERLEVYTRPIDDFKIKDFWKRELIIFDEADKREEFVQIGSHLNSMNHLLNLNKYRRKVDLARKEKKKIPKLNLAPMKKRRAFTGI